MANHIYKMIDIVGSSPDGVTDAMRKAGADTVSVAFSGSCAQWMAKP